MTQTVTDNKCAAANEQGFAQWREDVNEEKIEISEKCNKLMKSSIT